MRRAWLPILILIALIVCSPTVSGMQAKAAPKAAAASAAQVNLNTATAAQLETLPGIGASTARRIVEHRQKNGGFKKIEELMNVKGIGEKSFLKLKPLVTVSAEKAERSADQQ
jgi:competence protein ComEA